MDGDGLLCRTGILLTMDVHPGRGKEWEGEKERGEERAVGREEERGGDVERNREGGRRGERKVGRERHRRREKEKRGERIDKEGARESRERK